MTKSRMTRTILVSIAAVSAGVGWAGSGQAAAGADGERGTSSAQCATHGLDTASGVTAASSHFTYESVGKGAVATCTGRLNGHEITGPGTYFEHGPSFGSCSRGAGSGDFRLTVQTDAGLQTAQGLFYFYYVPGTGGVDQGEDFGAGFHVDFTFYPTKGDCVTTPVTLIQVDQTLTLQTG